MIRKNTNTISLTTKPKGFIGKFVLFFLWIFTLLPNSFSAANSKEASDEIIADSSYTITIPKSENKVLHISEGTTVYGMENISLPSSTDNPIINKEKKLKPKIKKQNYLAKTEEKKQVVQKRIQKVIVKTCISKNSKDSFDISKKHFNEGTVNTNLQFKISIITETLRLDTHYHGNTNSSYTYSNFLKGGLAVSYYFTRPPPCLA